MAELSTVSSSSTEKSYVSRIDTGKTSSDIYKEVDVLRAILWIHQGCDEVSELKVTKCFENGGVVKFDIEDDIPFDSEFDTLVKELRDQITSEEFVWFDNVLDPYEPTFDTNEENCR